jgi:prolyl 4-hydroxylase
VLHYRGGEEIRNHFDFIDPASPHYAEQIRLRGDRIITFLLYLNDDYREGETEFPEAGVKHKGTRGEGLFFVNVLEDGRPDLRTVHAGRPPTSGEKWIITQFIRNKPTF